MNRRTFISGTLGLLAAPLAAEAQQATKIARIGYLTTADVATAPPPPARGLPPRTA